jgi:predicted transcriptional regulator
MRHRLGFTQAEFCKLVAHGRLTQPQLSRIETGKTFPTFPQLRMLRHTLGQQAILELLSV